MTVVEIVGREERASLVSSSIVPRYVPMTKLAGRFQEFDADGEPMNDSAVHLLIQKIMNQQLVGNDGNVSLGDSHDQDLLH